MVRVIGFTCFVFLSGYLVHRYMMSLKDLKKKRMMGESDEDDISQMTQKQKINKIGGNWVL